MRNTRRAGSNEPFGRNAASVRPLRARTGALRPMRRHRTTARATLVALTLAGLGGRAFGTRQRERAGRRPAARLPARREDRPLGQLRRPARKRPPRGHRHGESVARAGRRGRGRARQVLGVRPRRLHALPLRRERNDVHVHPPEQRPHAAQRQQGRLRRGRRVRGPERRQGDGRPADRLERRLGRRKRQPAPALRGAPERRRGRQPVQAPEARDASRSSPRAGAPSSASVSAARSSRPGPARRRSRSIASGSTREAAGWRSTRARSS